MMYTEAWKARYLVVQTMVYNLMGGKERSCSDWTPAENRLAYDVYWALMYG